MSDDFLDDDKLRAWPAPEPPEGFADRVVAARRAPEPRRRRWWPAAALAAAALAAATALALWPGRATEHGTASVSERTELALGGRAIAVAEAGAALSWTVEGSGAARIEQARGDVFYRVERGGPFVVVTPAGDVSVKGTCFRVEVTEMRLDKQAYVGAAVGAAAMATVLVTVYEGRVLLANEHGRTEVRAGERASVGSDGIPGPAVAAREGGPGPRPRIVVNEAPPPSADTTREQLIARDAEQRKQIARLQARLAELEAGGGGGDGHGADLKTAHFFAPTHDELLAMAKSCTVQYDSPPLGTEPFKISPQTVASLHLNDEEAQAFAQTMTDVAARTTAQLRSIYVEVTGNAQAAEELSAQAMQREIAEKSGRDEEAQAAKQLSAERAGLVQPPANVAQRPAVERMMRLMQGVGDALEAELGKAIGPDRAHEIRAARDGWPSRTKMSGCPDEKADDAK
jgi:hypothetical protein